MTKPNLLVFLRIKAGREAEFDAMFEREFITRSRSEAGCIDYRLWTDESDPQEKVIVERWAGQEALDLHMAQEWFNKGVPMVDDFLEKPLTVRSYSDDS